MNESKKAVVRTRAGDRCEYCQLQQVDSPLARLHVDHVVPKKHGGKDSLENLALACIDCNLHKGVNLTGIDPESGEVVQLFNPRKQLWGEHFQWQGIRISGKTPTGRTTIHVLAMNSDEQLDLRST